MRLMPHSMEAEMALLGSLLLCNTSVNAKVLGEGSPDLFYRESHQRIFSAMKSLFGSGSPIDVVTLRDEMVKRGSLEECGGVLYLMELAEYVPSPATALHYLQIIRQMHERRQIIVSADAMMKSAFDETVPIEDIRSTASGLLVSMSSEGASGAAFQASEIIASIWDKADERAQKGGGISGISWGIPSLDHYTSGLEESKLYIVGGRPGMAKTALATSVATNIVMHYDSYGATLFFSIEMPAQEIMERMLCGYGRVNSTRLKEGRMSHEEYTRVRDASEAFWQSSLIIDDNPAPSSASMLARAIETKQKFGGLSAIFVDYLGLITPPSSRMETRIAIGENARAMKTMARMMECPVILLAQINRGVEKRDNRRPEMGDLAESGAIEAAADVIVFPFRPQYYERVDGVRNYELPEDAELIVAKCRGGATGSAMAEFIPAYTLFQPQRRG